MVRIKLPPVPPETDNVYAYWAAWLIRIFESTPTAGFRTRLIILWLLSGYGIVAAILYLGALYVESKEGQKKMWLWRFVARSNGRYIVGNQRGLFAVCSFASCGLFIGYFLSFDRAYLLEADRSNVFYWRSVIWINVGLHLWISSWANLQATIISSQTATNRQILGPRLSNFLYLGGICLGFFSILGFAIACGSMWHKTWDAQERLEYRLLALSFLQAADSESVARAKVASLVSDLNKRLRPFVTILRSVNALCAVGAALIVLVNFGGLAVLLSLHRQIEFHFVDALACPAATLTRRRQSLSLHFDDHIESTAPDWPDPATCVGAEQDVEGREPAFTVEANSRRASLSSTCLKRILHNQSSVNSALRQKAMRLLELRKVRRDVIALLTVIVLLASVCLAIALWLAISPTSVYDDWVTIEVAYMLVPWMYLFGIDAALTFLLVNSIRHLQPVRRAAELQRLQHAAPSLQPVTREPVPMAMAVYSEAPSLPSSLPAAESSAPPSPGTSVHESETASGPKVSPGTDSLDVIEWAADFL